MDFLLSVIYVREGGGALRAIPLRILYLYCLGETVFPCRIWRKATVSACFPLKCVEAWALFRKQPWQVKGIARNVKWTECSKATRVVFPDLFPLSRPYMFCSPWHTCELSRDLRDFYINLLFMQKKEWYFQTLLSQKSLSGLFGSQQYPFIGFHYKQLFLYIPMAVRYWRRLKNL